MNKKTAGIFITLVSIAILLMVYYSYSITNANKLIYGPWGDGYKNMYTSAYYLRHDNGTHFSGMNYPYGEHVVFTDNQPVISWILKGVWYVWPGIANYYHAIPTLPIFISILLAGLLIYFTLLELKVSPLHGAVFSVFIAMLSPQMLRLLGHYSLAHSVFVPLLIYLLVKLLNTGKVNKYAALLGLVTLFFSFVHLYYLATSALFLLSFSFFYAIIKWKEDKHALISATKIAAAAIIPFIAFKVFMLLTDSIPDRPNNPYGFFVYCTDLFNVFTHEYSFAFPFFEMLRPTINNEFEGRGYVGLIPTICAVVLIVLFVYTLVTKRSNYFSKLGNWQIILLASLPVLMIAMALPFRIGPLQKVYEMLPMVFKQFRAPGRFAWVFYYVFTITSSVFIYRLFEQLHQKTKWAAFSFIAIVYTLWFLDMNTVNNRIAANFKQYGLQVDEEEETERLNNKLAALGKSPASFQAIYALPIFLGGSEKLDLQSVSNFEGMRISLELGLPLTCGQLSRTSFAQTHKLVRAYSSELIEKDVLNDYKSDKPLLMMVVFEGLSQNDKRIIEKGEFLFDDAGKRYFELPLSALHDGRDSIKQYYNNNQALFYKHPDYISTDSTDNVVIKRFEDNPHEEAAFGKGCYYQEKGQVFLYFDTLPNAQAGDWYEISAWVYADLRTAAYPLIYVTQLNGENEVAKYESNGKFSVDIYKKWARLSVLFQLTDAKNKVYLAGEGNYAFYDELMIRPTKVNVITAKESNTKFTYDNYAIE